MTFVLVGFSCASAWSFQALEEDESGSSSRQFRNQAVESIPFQQLNPAAQEKIHEIVDRPSLYRRLPVTTIATDPDYFRFLVRYPEVIVNIWQLMGVTQMTTKRTGPFTLDTNDGAGTISNIELVYGNETMHVFYGSGTYEGPVIRKKLTGRCVLVLQTNYSKDAQGQPQATNQLDVFLKIDNATLGLMAKTIQPVVGPTADHNFTESLKFVQRLNSTTEENGPGVQGMATRMDLDDDVREKFIEMAGIVYERALRSTTQPATVPGIAPMPNAQYPTSYRAPVSSVLPAATQPSFLAPATPGVAPSNYSQPVSGNLPPQSNHRACGSVYSLFSDQRFLARPVGYEAPNYEPLRR